VIVVTLSASASRSLSLQIRRLSTPSPPNCKRNSVPRLSPCHPVFVSVVSGCLSHSPDVCFFSTVAHAFHEPRFPASNGVVQFASTAIVPTHERT